MTPEKLEKIRRLAGDPRGDPATRAIAQAALKRYAEGPLTSPAAPRYEDVRHPGLKTSAEFDRFKFMDLGSWKKTSAGNPTYSIVRNGVAYKIVLFRHKKTPTWGWMRVNTIEDTTEFSGKFSTIGEAHNDSWRMLTSLSH